MERITPKQLHKMQGVAPLVTHGTEHVTPATLAALRAGSAVHGDAHDTRARRGKGQDWTAMLCQQIEFFAKGYTPHREALFAQPERNFRADILIVAKTLAGRVIEFETTNKAGWKRILNPDDMLRGLIIEIHGGTFAGQQCPACKQHTANGHNRGAGFRSDIEKTALAMSLGYAVLPVMPEHIKDNVAIDWVIKALARL